MLMTANKKPQKVRRALVTGAANGIGWAICQRLAADGYRLALADLDNALLNRRLQSLGEAHVGIQIDLTEPSSAAGLPDRALQALGGLDVIVNNAGITDSSGLSLVEMNDGVFTRMVALNLTAVEQICLAAPDALCSGGRIVNVASGAAFRPLALRGPYSATKAGVVALTKALADEYAAFGIGVLAIAPGYTRTALVDELHQTGRVDLDKVAASIPMGRLALPEDIASVVAFAAGAAAQSLSGQTLLVDGGGSMGPGPTTGAPEPGTAARGRLAVFGPLDVDGSVVDATEQSRLASIGALSAVIDSELFNPGLSLSEAMQRARLTVKACAKHRGRAGDFSLLFVSPEGATTAGKVAAEARAMLARTLALEWAASGIRVNALTWRGATCNGLSAVCRFLVGQDAKYLTGQHVYAQDPSRVGE